MSGHDEPGLSQIERELYAELAACIALDVYNPIRWEPDDGGERRVCSRVHDDVHRGMQMEHPLESSLENAFSTLSKLGIVDSISYDYSSYYRLLIELKNIPEHVSNRGKFDDPPLSEMISVFVGVIDHFDVLSTEREPFQPILHRNALRLLAETGYAEKLDDRYRWTDKIAAAMRENVVWNEAGESYRALHDADIDQAIETMWETMPDTIRRRFGADPERVVLIDLIRAISRCWRDGEWVNPSENAGRFFMPSETVDIARGLLRKFKENPK